MTLILEKCRWVAIDTETIISDFRAGEGTVRGFSLGYEIGGIVYSFYIPIGHYSTDTWTENIDFDRIKPLLQEILDTKKVMIFNAQFDLVILEHVGLYTSDCDFYDIMVLAHLVDENRPFEGKSLDACARFYLDDPGKQKSKEFKDVVKYAGWDFLPASLMAPYASWDANMTYRLYWPIQPKLKEEALGAIWAHKREMIRLLIKMGYRGIKINLDLARQMEQQGEKEMINIIVDKLGGLDPGKKKDREELFWNQLKLPVIKHEKTGNPTFDKSAMAEYEQMLENTASDSRLARAVIEWRGWQKAVTAYYRPYQQRVSTDGRLRCNYKLHGTVTGRLSSVEPNLQQIPKTTDKPWNGHLKNCFVPETGYELWEFDYSQLELRLATSYAKIPVLLEIFADPSRDIFTEMAETLGMSRSNTKTLVYAIQYGAGATHLSKVFRVSFSVAKNHIENFYTQYPNFKKLSQAATAQVLRKGKLKLWSGRYRHFINPSKEAHKALNSFIQGGAADIVERQMVRLDKEGYNNEQCRMLLQIHDSIVFEIKTERKEYYIPRIQQIMEDVKSIKEFGITFRVDSHRFGE